MNIFLKSTKTAHCDSAASSTTGPLFSLGRVVASSAAKALSTSGGAAVSDSLSWPVEPFEVPPHPCNIQFLDALSVHLMKNLGECMHRITEVEGVEWTPCFLRDFFVPVSDAVLGLQATTNVVRFAAGRPGSSEPALKMSSFTDLMARVPEPVLEFQCAVARNLDWLQTALHLSSVETKLLLWTYAVSHRRSENLRNAFAAMRFGGRSSACAAFALLLDEPRDAVIAAFTAPSRLVAMRLSWTERCTAEFGLDEYFMASELLPAVLETVHRSPEAMLERLLEPERNWTLAPEVQTPTVLYYEWFERPVADAFAATVLGRPLTADHIVALIEWLTGFRLEPAQCSLLAGHLTLETIEQTIKRCFVVNGRCDRAVTPLMVLSTLYSAAS